MVSVMPRQDLAWLDNAGAPRVVQKHRFADVPAELAQRARARGLLFDDPDSDVATKLRRESGQRVPDFATSVRIDADEPPPPAAEVEAAHREPILAEPVVGEPYNRGPSYQMKVPTGRAHE
jgi:hypothetical protein